MRPARSAALAVATALLAASTPARADTPSSAIIPLWPEGTVPSLGVPERREQVPEAGGLLIRDVSAPTLEVFRPASGTANGTAVIVVPGGGFVGLAYESEGTAVAAALAQRGITAFVLKYRTILSTGSAATLPPVHLREMDLIMARAKSGLPLEVPRFAGEANAVADGARALLLVRQRAREWGVAPQRIGMIGFSAGGYLAADLAIGDAATRPAFVGLIYGGLRTPVPAEASPAFIAAAADDAFQPDDAALLHAAWRKAGASSELHIFEHGGHGFGLARRGATSDHWLDEFLWWLEARGLMQEGPHEDR